MRLIHYLTIIKSMPEYFDPLFFVDNKKLHYDEHSKKMKHYIRNKLFGNDIINSFQTEDNKNLPSLEFIFAENLSCVGMNCYIENCPCIHIPACSYFCFPSRFEYLIENQLDMVGIDAVQVGSFDARGLFKYETD